MKNGKESLLKDAGELAVIKRICRHLPAGQSIIQGAGDDCAVVRAGTSRDWLLTSDAVIEGTHFHPGTPFPAIGHKAVARALSDIASMGGTPEWALVDLVAPPLIPVRAIDEIYRAATEVAGRYGLLIVGGDTARGPVLELHVFAVGFLPRGSAILRSGAKPGDVIFVTGALGGSSLGRHLKFEPRIMEGLFLRKWASAMIDVSDGLATDLRHITDMSRTGATIDTLLIPVSADARRLKDKSSAICHALHDGEDFELLFTVPSKRVKAFQSAWKRNFSLPCSRIGCMTQARGIIECIGKNGMVTELEKTGYQHFKR